MSAANGETLKLSLTVSFRTMLEKSKNSQSNFLLHATPNDARNTIQIRQ